MLFILTFVACSAIGEDDYTEIVTTTPYSFIVVPDTVSLETKNVTVLFDYAESNSGVHYLGSDIITENENEVTIQMRLQKESNPEHVYLTSFITGIDSVVVNMSGKSDIELNFLNSENETVFSKKIVKAQTDSMSFVLKYDATNLSGYTKYDSLAVIFHNNASLNESIYIDTLFVPQYDNFVIRKNDVPIEYSELFYSFVGYVKNPENGEYEVSKVYTIFLEPIPIVRGIPTSIQFHQ